MNSMPKEPKRPWSSRRVSDPKELRALAHPVRFALIDLLLEGPMTATQCAARLGESPANCSYHLRQLAKYGHVHPTEGGRGRERYWAAREEGITIADDGPGGAAAARAVGEAVDEYRMNAWRAFTERRSAESESWRRAAVSTDLVTWLTEAELVAVTEDLYDLFSPYAARDSDPHTRPAGARAVRFFAYAFPGVVAHAEEARS